MKITFIKFFDKFIIILLFFTGVFSSCSKPEREYNGEKYGIPIPLYGVQQSVFITNENDNLNEIPKEITSKDVEFEQNNE